jgi:hypothetical protein
VTDENPFDPKPQGAPLALTIDGPSLLDLEGEPLREALFLLELGHGPAVELLVLEPPRGFAVDLPQARLAAPDLERDHRNVEYVGAGGFAGGVQPWTVREARADELGLSGEQRERWLWLDAATWFSRNSRSEHFFVTADEDLLDWVKVGGDHGYWSRRNILSFRRALRFIDWAMLAQRELVVRAKPGYTQTTSRFTMAVHLAYWLMPSRARLGTIARLGPFPGSTSPLDELGQLEQSILARSLDILRARDGVALAWLRDQNNATLEEILFYLRSAIPAATGLFDAVAVFASLALKFDELDVKGGPARVALRNRSFRQALRRRGAPLLADASASYGTLWSALAAVRNPVIHGPGLGGMGYQRIPGAPESRVLLSPLQAQAFEDLAGASSVPPKRWGIEDEVLGQVAIEPLLFCESLTRAVFDAAETLMAALADDLGTPPAERSATAEERETVWRYALLTGMVDDIRQPS